jgi:hypothetical protein
MHAPTVFHSQQSAAVIRGVQPLREVSLAPQTGYANHKFTTAGAATTVRNIENVHPNIM